ncbi:hypothetical protein GDO81_020541 [Engystomops pustulosus]|uniref:Uncharacterized protein n=1 Tax=Engystomops pustulosus TaxID=76066 RepID=A0AAV6ZN71_ENGPU|nr:hypothetical protein GDO81_020541 [Engystomops pustulosus]
MACLYIECWVKGVHTVSPGHIYYVSGWKVTYDQKPITSVLELYKKMFPFSQLCPCVAALILLTRCSRAEFPIWHSY